MDREQIVAFDHVAAEGDQVMRQRERQDAMDQRVIRIDFIFTRAMIEIPQRQEIQRCQLREHPKSKKW